MQEINLSDQQRRVAEHDLRGAVFLEGPAGTGKTTAALARLHWMLEQGVPGNQILLLVPQRTLALNYEALLRDPSVGARSPVTILTLGGLARNMVDVFWPLAGEVAGFDRPAARPTFLSLETAQYYMARVLAPLIAQRGYFETVTLDRNRLYSQILDNLNKAALVGFSHRTIGERLKSAVARDDLQRRVFDEVQDCANIFREFCLQHNLLDFSLQVEILMNHLWPLPQCRTYLSRQYRHLIFENVEEDTPATHDILRDWLPDFDSALLIYDHDAGFRRFLGADPNGGYALRERCAEQIILQESYVTVPPLRKLAQEFAVSLDRPVPDAEANSDPREILVFEDHRYYPQMLDWTAGEIRSLVHDHGVPPGEIVVIAPYLSDALRFSLMNRLESLEVPVRSHRPSRSLREEPAARALLTLAQIAHPEWGLRPTPFDMAYALMTAIEGLDLVRAQLLAQIVYREREGALSGFDRIHHEMQSRITYTLGRRYEQLRDWLTSYLAAEPEPLDHFFSRLFGEVLSQAGFGFHNNFDAAEVAANLVDSTRQFRWTIQVEPVGKTLAQEYVEMVQAGIIADQYLRSWELETVDAVLLAPAYTYLMRNVPVQYQFWLNVGGTGWAERLYQPLTHPYVLTRDWQERPTNAVWTDFDEVEASQDALYRLLVGLVRRCRGGIYLGLSELGEQGYEQQGVLLRTFQRMLLRLSGGQEEVQGV